MEQAGDLDQDILGMSERIKELESIVLAENVRETEDLDGLRDEYNR